jgi:hypothetical protein
LCFIGLALIAVFYIILPKNQNCNFEDFYCLSSDDSANEDRLVRIFDKKQIPLKTTEVDKDVKEDFLNLFYLNRFGKNEVTINGNKVKVSDLDEHVRDYIWLLKAKKFKQKLYQNFQKNGIYDYIKHLPYNKFVDSIADCKINSLFSSELYAIDKELLSKINE